MEADLLSLIQTLERHLHYLGTITQGDANATIRAIREFLLDRARLMGLDL